MCKIGLIGCAGNGRSTIAREVSEKLNIPFIGSSSITRDILVRDKYNYADDQFVEKFLSLREVELINKRIEIENSYDKFITDRTVIDHFAYLHLSIERYPNVAEIEKLCFEQVKKYTHLFYLKPTYFEYNGVRTVNVRFQNMIDWILRGIIEDYNINVIKIDNLTADNIISYFQ